MIHAEGPTIVFCRTRHGADKIAKRLGAAGVQAAPIHGGLSQNQRDRALAAFTRGKVHALIATDVAARGIHVDDVACVLHFDPPTDAKTYVHRSGRTARKGATGVVVSFVAADQQRASRQLQRVLGIGDVGPEPRSESRPSRNGGNPRSRAPAPPPLAVAALGPRPLSGCAGGRGIAHPFGTGLWAGSLETVRDHVRRFGAIDVCTFRKGWFADTTPQHTEPIVLCFLDVDYQASLHDCLTHLWPKLLPKGYMFLDDFVFLDSARSSGLSSTGRRTSTRLRPAWWGRAPASDSVTSTSDPFKNGGWLTAPQASPMPARTSPGSGTSSPTTRRRSPGARTPPDSGPLFRGATRQSPEREMLRDRMLAPPPSRTPR